jgi:protein-tyrosine phosphatase
MLPPAFDLAAVADDEPHEYGMSAARCEPMSRIEDHLYIGSWRDVEEVEALRSAGITHILNVAKEVDPTINAASLEQFKSLHIPLVDEHRENILNHMESACTFIEAARECGGKCLVHCRRGISRSPAIVVGYLMRHEKLPYEQAVDYVKERRLCVSLNIAFREFLSAYDTPRMKLTAKTDAHFAGPESAESTTQPTPGASDVSDGGDPGHAAQ